MATTSSAFWVLTNQGVAGFGQTLDWSSSGETLDTAVHVDVALGIRIITRLWLSLAVFIRCTVRIAFCSCSRIHKQETNHFMPLNKSAPLFVMNLNLLKIFRFDFVELEFIFEL